MVSPKIPPFAAAYRTAGLQETIEAAPFTMVVTPRIPERGVQARAFGMVDTGSDRQQGWLEVPPINGHFAAQVESATVTVERDLIRLLQTRLLGVTAAGAGTRAFVLSEDEVLALSDLQTPPEALLERVVEGLEGAPAPLRGASFLEGGTPFLDALADVATLTTMMDKAARFSPNPLVYGASPYRLAAWNALYASVLQHDDEVQDFLAAHKADLFTNPEVLA